MRTRLAFSGAGVEQASGFLENGASLLKQESSFRVQTMPPYAHQPCIIPVLRKDD
jgi:hypothetical protein